ncbi:MAG: fused MFS/spermidine synthase [Gemmatimonadota bacterium]
MTEGPAGQGVHLPAGRWFVALYTLTAFANAALLFSVEPMFAKLALPLLGGTPSVWNTALVFFQAALLLGYAYAHATSRWLRPGQQAAVHAVLLAMSCLALPIRLHAGGGPPVGAAAIGWLVLVFTVSIGLPFAVLASGAPLLQRWFASSTHERAANPYFLYAASNAGSLCALLSYPFLIEPWFSLVTQRAVWSAGYVLVMALVAACVWYGLRARTGEAHAQPSRPEESAEPITARDRARWVLYAAVPSSLLMGVTTYITTDVASVPLLWVVPLSLYLLSFIFTFATRPPVRHEHAVRAESYALIGAALLLFWTVALPGLVHVVFHFGVLFLVAMVCHGELSRRRPPARGLTEFFLWISVGGLVGGVFNALLAPVLFTEVVEYPLALAIAGFLRPLIVEADPEAASDTDSTPRRERLLDIVFPLAVLLVLTASAIGADIAGADRFITGITVVVATVILHGSTSRPVRFGLALGAVFVADGLRPKAVGYHKELHAERSFFGVYRVRDNADGSFRHLMHGTTLHGSQSRAFKSKLDPLTYYHRDGPIGDLFAYEGPEGALHALVPAGIAPSRRVALVGLGTGTLACYGRTGEVWTFYEIDPVVQSIASDPRFFTYMRDCPPVKRVVLGDARLTLRRAPDAAYDVMVLDAFSSDAIPVHLLTREAFAQYFRVLSPRGVLAVHISNRHLDLEPVVAAIAEESRLFARVRADTRISSRQIAAGQSGAVWVLLARDSASLGGAAASRRWLVLQPSGDVWTDDFSNVLRALR